MKKIASFLLIGIFIICCSSDKNIPDHHSLLGNWNWIESTGGFAGVTLTPESTGNTIILQISNTTIKKYVNGKLESELKYTIEIGPSIFGDKKPMIVYENDSKSSFELVDNQLILNEECNDCFQSKYLRKTP
ncbi:hypothetical protein SLW70_15630 [Flavobacterium sp. NG2]|uniref:hypothetical protein n=1 Tax=Flavobacterium sp. NG2 TaxID=3097547 RepID=UPI002A7F1E3E|nr:hypothetical protein [Flavobacterium sp. NG2]WPR71344.1 hypothetical protein SLW70_15630 [Flavobacterium sp. NG2]